MFTLIFSITLWSEVSICGLQLHFLFFWSLFIHGHSHAWHFPLSIRRQHEAELKKLEEETARRIEEAIRKNVEERLHSEEVKLTIERRIEEGRKKLFEDVAAQLEKEKEAALIEARQKEVSILKWVQFFISSL